MNYKRRFTHTPKFGVALKRGGFSLIELLLVVSIIGLLISVTLGYLSNARAKGNDAGVISNLGTIRALSEIYYLDNSDSYLPAGGATFNIAPCPVYNVAGTNMFSRNQSIALAIIEATARGESNACYNSGTNWAIAVGLKSQTGTSWCVDNQGTAKVVNSNPMGAISPVTFYCN